MPQKWRLLDTGVSNAPMNMALEKVLLDSCAEDTAPNTLHLLEFFPCVLIGYSQNVEEEVNEDFCSINGIKINRRISGGGCIYTDGGTLGWEIIAKKNTPGIPASLEEMYKKLCGGIILLLSEFGIDAAYRPLNDVEACGRKISGTGGTELNDSFIFHGTVLVDFDVNTMQKALKTPLKQKHHNLKTRTVSIRELMGYAPSMEEVKEKLVRAFSKILDIEFEKGGLSAEETEALSTKLAVFSSGDWIYRRQSIL